MGIAMSQKNGHFALGLKKLSKDSKFMFEYLIVQSNICTFKNINLKDLCTLLIKK